MGYEQRIITIHAYVSRHNSEQDKEDDADWERLRERIEWIVAEHQYERINAQVV
jgi:hypothetical protein